MKKWTAAGVLLAGILILGGCKGAEHPQQLKDGFYTAQMSDYSHGWKEYVTITVKGGEIINTEYNAENASGFIKSWDNAYMNQMKSVTGTYPNEYTRYYASQLTGCSELPDIELLSGASSSGGNFQKLSLAVVKQAVEGDSRVVTVEAESEKQ